jgi:glycosyltransferase involved in cell wall biosynthesis
MKKSKLLYIHNQGIQPFSSGGLNTTLLQVFSMCNAFARVSYIVTLAMEGDEKFNEKVKLYIEKSFNDGIIFSVIHWNRRHNNSLINRILVKSRILQIAKKIDPDLIFTREPYILKDIIKLNVPIIFESHSTKLHNRFTIIHRFLKNRILRSSTNPHFKCMFSISQALSDFWQKQGIPKEKLFSWHDGFDISLFKEVIDKNKARKMLNLPKNKIIVTYTGGLYPDREVDNIIYLAREFDHLYFLIIGGPEKNRKFYQNIANEKSVFNINFIGFIEHKLIPHYLFASDILLALWSSKVSTINYCSPLKLFEYMAAGKIILAHDFPTIREVLDDNVDSILCAPDDFMSLKSKLDIALIKLQSSNFGEISRKKAFELFTWNSRVNHLNAFISLK